MDEQSKDEKHDFLPGIFDELRVIINHSPKEWNWRRAG
jgi:hypothetical protein